jgi:hypothetical protein
MPSWAPPADLSDLTLPANINIQFPDGKDKLMHFEITLKPDEGYYRCEHAACTRMAS